MESIPEAPKKVRSVSPIQKFRDWRQQSKLDNVSTDQVRSTSPLQMIKDALSSPVSEPVSPLLSPQRPPPKMKPGQLSDEELASGRYTTCMTRHKLELPCSSCTLEYYLILPTDYSVDCDYPVAIAISGEKQQHVSRFFQSWKAENRGWIVACPLRPDDWPLFFQGSDVLLQKFASHILDNFRAEGNRLHLVGVSNGGHSAFHFATRWPELCHSVTLAPGYNFWKVDVTLVNGIPIDMYVGDDDELGFTTRMIVLKGHLDQAGHKPDAFLKTVNGAGHRTLGQFLKMEEFWQRLELKRPGRVALANMPDQC